MQTIGMKYTGKYPIKLTITKYFKDKRQDLDNTRIKGLIDGLVDSDVIKNDNLNHIINIELRAKFGEEDKLIIEIEEEPKR